jgi:hypothetical protein
LWVVEEYFPLQFGQFQFINGLLRHIFNPKPYAQSNQLAILVRNAFRHDQMGIAAIDNQGDFGNPLKEGRNNNPFGNGVQIQGDICEKDAN